MKALVVGGTGFVGMNVVRALVDVGHDVAATRRERSNTLFARKLGAKLIGADLDDEDSLVQVMGGREVVFMCAGHYPRYSLDPDADVALAQSRVGNCIRAAQRARVDRLVLTSSVATVGSPRGNKPLSDESDPIDESAKQCAYHAVKWSVEQRVLAAQGPDCVVLCPTGIVGALDVKVGTGFLIVATAHEKLHFYVDGRTNIVDADEVAQAHIAAAEHGIAGERYIIAGTNTTVRQLLDLVAETVGVRLSACRIPLWLASAISTLDEMRCLTSRTPRAFMAREFVDLVQHGQWVDGSKAQRELGLNPPAPLFKTIRKACRWYERHRYIRLPQSG